MATVMILRQHGHKGTVFPRLGASCAHAVRELRLSLPLSSCSVKPVAPCGRLACPLSIAWCFCLPLCLSVLSHSAGVGITGGCILGMSLSASFLHGLLALIGAISPRLWPALCLEFPRALVQMYRPCLTRTRASDPVMPAVYVTVSATAFLFLNPREVPVQLTSAHTIDCEVGSSPHTAQAGVHQCTFHE